MFHELAATSVAHAYVVDHRWMARAAPITQETDEFIAMLTVAVKNCVNPPRCRGR